jgi:hypothetical protein
MSANFLKKAAISVASAVTIAGFAAPAAFAMGSDGYGGGGYDGGNSNFTTTSFNSNFSLSLQIQQSTSFSTTSYNRYSPMMRHHHHNYGNWGGYGGYGNGYGDNGCNRGYSSSWD